MRVLGAGAAVIYKHSEGVVAGRGARAQGDRLRSAEVLTWFSTSSTKPARPRQRTGCCSLRTALASICRTRSRVTEKILPDLFQGVGIAVGQAVTQPQDFAFAVVQPFEHAGHALLEQSWVMSANGSSLR